tara:strand:- start:3657 stop:4457 length:801 start_codon:yes stop_codon:yes gene_type:complete
MVVKAEVILDNNTLRRNVVKMVYQSGWGHIPSSFSILEIVNLIYSKLLKFDKKNHKWPGRDYFILSKGHGCVGLYSVLEKFGLLKKIDIKNFCRPNGILGEHPDSNKIKFVEASCGSLGHGLGMAVGIAKGFKIKNKKNKVLVLVGDGECHEGTIWEAAHIASNYELDNLRVFLDFNQSGMQLLPKENFLAKWNSFGWDVAVSDGHNEKEIYKNYKKLEKNKNKKPKIIICKTIKGKGVSFIEGHGPWHHKIPNENELKLIMKELR